MNEFQATNQFSFDASQRAQINTMISIEAMSTINEIIHRHCVPTDFEDFLLQMFHNTFQLLQLLVQNTSKDVGNDACRVMVVDEL